MKKGIAKALLFYIALTGLFIWSCCQDWYGVAEAEKVVEAELRAKDEQRERVRMACIVPTLPPTATPEQQEKMVREYRYIKDCGLNEGLQRAIFDICDKNNISFELVMAIIRTESGYNVNCVSDDGASVGLMQIQERWHGGLMDKLGVKELSEPVGNVKVGVALLKSYFNENSDVSYVLMRYNGGKAYADRMVASGEISSYARKVMRAARLYEIRNGI